MTAATVRAGLIGAALAGFLTLAVGCGGGGQPEAAHKEGDGHDHGKQANKGHTHGGWWCDEHGVPEHECLSCLHTEAELKKKGDWCAEHEVAKSQCFKCDPSLKEKYAAKYRAKYGKEPPPVEGEKGAEGDKDKKDDKK